MIHYVYARPHSYTLGIFLEHHCPAIAAHVRLVDYDSFFRLETLPGGAVILTDFDRLSSAALARAAAYHAFLSRDLNRDLSRDASPVRVLNDPARSLQRFELLRRLHENGTNQFNVYRLDESHAGCRFPVFIRRERSHLPVLTGLIGNAAELARAIRAIRRRNAWRFFSRARLDLADLMVVEFLHAPGKDGRFRKYGVYKVGDVLYAQHCFIRDQWHVKGPAVSLDDADRREHREFVAANPHAEQVAAIFAMAHIDYGRIDYTVLNGNVQVFEINTNPTVLTGPPSAFNYDTRPYAERHEQAMRSLLDSGIPERTVEIPLELRARR